MKTIMLSVLLFGLAQFSQAQSFGNSVSGSEIQDFDRGPHPGFGGPHPGPGFGGPRPFPGDNDGEWHRPGWNPGWRWDYGWRPGWYNPGIAFPPFVWGYQLPFGYWQCTAFNAYLVPFTDAAPTMDQAAYGALYFCGGPGMGCYIPYGYCQVR